MRNVDAKIKAVQQRPTPVGIVHSFAFRQAPSFCSFPFSYSFGESIIKRKTAGRLFRLNSAYHDFIMTLVAFAVLMGLVSSCNNGHAWKAQTDQSASSPSECDTLAAHPEDVTRLAKGVPDAEIIPALALEKCSAAVTSNPNNSRLMFQLGRSLLASNRTEEATKAFGVAARLGSCPAKFYLGENALSVAKKSGTAEDFDRALEYYREASACSFPSAETRLAQWQFSADNFQCKPIVEELYDGKIEDLNEARLLVAEYLRGFNGYISLEFHPAHQACPGELSDSRITYELDSAAAGDPRMDHPWERPMYEWGTLVGTYLGKWIDPVWQGDPEKYREYLKSLGRSDAIRLISQYGCDGPVTLAFYKQLKSFARSKRPLVEYAPKLWDKGKELGLVGSSNPEQK